MKKLMIIGFVAAFSFACTTPETDQDIEAYGTKKSESVNTEGSSDEFEFDNSED